MAEFVRVTYPTHRNVRVNSTFQGVTGQVIGVTGGLNTFDLDAPADYSPPSQTVTVLNHPRSSPLVIAFHPAAPVADAVADAAPPPTPIASRHSDIFHRSIGCPAAARIVGPNALFGTEARAGRTLHPGCTG